MRWFEQGLKQPHRCREGKLQVWKLGTLVLHVRQTTQSGRILEVLLCWFKDARFGSIIFSCVHSHDSLYCVGAKAGKNNNFYGFGLPKSRRPVELTTET
jgi:hypothetical protein